jgi:hypothetical protein
MADSDSVTKKDLEDALAQVKVLIREVQDVLLAHFLNHMKAHSMRLDARESLDSATLERLHVLEERVVSLETRRGSRPN